MGPSPSTFHLQKLVAQAWHSSPKRVADGRDHGIRWVDLIPCPPSFKTNFLPDGTEKYLNIIQQFKHPPIQGIFFESHPNKQLHHTRSVVPESPANSSPTLFVSSAGPAERTSGDRPGMLPNLVWLVWFCLEFPKFA